MKIKINTLLLLLILIGMSFNTLAQHESKPFKISEAKWKEFTHDYKIRDSYKNTEFRYAVDISKEVLGGYIITKRTVYSSSSCNCILLVIHYEKGEPIELVDHVFKFKKHYSRDKKEWRFEKRVDRVGFQRCQ